MNKNEIKSLLKAMMIGSIAALAYNVVFHNDEPINSVILRSIILGTIVVTATYFIERKKK